MSLLSTKISLYIHIPFCFKKCNYCDFYSEVGNRNIMKSVVTQLRQQLLYWLEKLDNPKIDTIFIGGGTPSYLPLDLLEQLFRDVTSLVGVPKEWTVEANPETITKGFLTLCNKYEVSRLSIGIQSFNEKTLKVLGRNCSLNSIENGLNLVNKYWKNSYSLDLITSVPGQTLLSAEEDVLKAISYNPEHISYYSLILEDGTPLEDDVSKGVVKELDEDEATSVWLRGRELLEKNSYINYEVSNYTKNKPSYHNINYWELRPYLGIGPGAASTLIDTNGDIVRIHNKKSIEEFIKGKSVHWGEEVEKLSPKEFLKDYVMMGFRLKKGINRERFRKIFKLDIKDLVMNINSLDLKKLFIIDDNNVSLTDKGYNIMNSIIIELIDYIDRLEVTEVKWFY